MAQLVPKLTLFLLFIPGQPVRGLGTLVLSAQFYTKHMRCDLEFYLFFLFRLLLKDYFGACSINACLWCLLI